MSAEVGARSLARTAFDRKVMMTPTQTIVVTVLLTVVSVSVTEAKEAATPSSTPPPAPTQQTVCALIERSAIASGIPIDFLTRLIWRESAFHEAAVSPKGAQGIAQFMPGTAVLRGLADPFDAEKAIPASAAYLGELVGEFGNLGLAAAAYNAGEARVAVWLAGTGGLPAETRAYVFAITGRSVEDWKEPQRVLPVNAALPSEEPDSDCLTVAATLGNPGAGASAVSSPPAGPSAPWGVQVAGDFSLNRAMAGYANLQRACGSVVGTQAPMVVRTVNWSRGTAPLFQIRIPAGSADEANGICRKLHAQGCACVVMKN